LFPILLALTVLGLDQFTKWLVVTRMAEFETIPVIPGFFSIQFVYNTGAAFGILQNQTWFLVLVATVAAGVILYYLRRPEAKWGVLPLALGLLLGGTLGNLVDRVRFGKVVDFFLFYWKDYRFPNFNVADIGITVGVALLALYLGLTGEKTAG